MGIKDEDIDTLFAVWDYEIDGETVPVSIRRQYKAKDMETYFSCTATIKGEHKQWFLRITDDINACFKFTSDDVPQALKDAETEISDSIMQWDNFGEHPPGTLD